MKLDYLKRFYDNCLFYVNRNKEIYPAQYLKGYFEGTFSILKQLVVWEDLEDLPKLEVLNEKDNFKQIEGLEIVYKINIFDNYYPVYLNDYGQCYCILIDDKLISFGSYNSEIEIGSVYEVFLNIFNKDFKKLEGE